MTKLTEAMVVGIRRAYARTRNLPMRSKARISLAKLASNYGMSKTQVWRIIQRKSWKHVHIQRPKSEPNQ